MLGAALSGYHLPSPLSAPYPGNIGMHYCVMLGLCVARHILDPREQISTFEPLGARPVTDRDTFPVTCVCVLFPCASLISLGLFYFLVFVLFPFVCSTSFVILY